MCSISCAFNFNFLPRRRRQTDLQMESDFLWLSPAQSTGTVYRVCTQHTDMCPIWPEGNQMCNSILAGMAETDWNIICRGVGNCDANMKSRGIIIITIII